MKVREYCVYLRKLNKNDLLLELEKTEQELFSLKLNIRAGQMKNHARIANLRRTVARVKTVLHSNF